MKRGESGLSLVVGVNKPVGMTSHDVVNRCRRIFGERRVGHAGTLDPAASGVLPVCVGPATRLDQYLTGHDKAYRAIVAFGASTDTDDAQGAVVQESDVPAEAWSERFARGVLNEFVGASNQLPPAYSAIKVGGKKACDAARAGVVIDLAPRPIVVYAAELLSVREVAFQGRTLLAWDVAFEVSKGTYIRSLARDIGIAVGCASTLAGLERTRVGALGLESCVTLEALEEAGARAALDPIDLLGFRLLFARDDVARRIGNGGALDPRGLELFCPPDRSFDEMCACTSGLAPSCKPLEDGERISVVESNKLAAIYAYDQEKERLKADCVFRTGVIRGCYL